jgi:hypothetical protein
VTTCASGDSESERGESDYVNDELDGSDGEGQRGRGMERRLRPQRGSRREPEETQQRTGLEGRVFWGGPSPGNCSHRLG